MTELRAQTGNNDVLLSVRNLCTYFPVRGALGRAKRVVKAVDGVSFDIPRGRTLGLVGESGCGKTTTGRTALRLIPATSGSVMFDGLDISRLAKAPMRRLRRRMQIIFQDPMGSLNPRMTVGDIIGEGLKIHHMASGRGLRDRGARLLTRVGLSPSHARCYPHEFSGGQQQRIGIARAIALEPEFIVCDEPVSALDVSVQSQILNLLNDLKRDLGLTYLFIAHNLAVVKHFSDIVAVMYLGKIVEIALGEDIYSHPRHPYTQALLSAVPEPDPTKRSQRIVLTGEVPSPVDPPSGCAFHPRCPFAIDQCRRQTPTLESNAGVQSGHLVACHRASEGLAIGRDGETARLRSRHSGWTGRSRSRLGE